MPITVLRQKVSVKSPAKQGVDLTLVHQFLNPKEVHKRETFGHWELDTIVSGRGKAKGCVATCIERMTRWYVGFLIPNRSRAVRLLHTKLPKGTIKTATTDRGKEFSCYKVLEKDLKIDVYFADAYSSWQRGSNENGNGLLREFFPKQTNFEEVSPEELTESLNYINNRPRKCLGWKTANEAFNEQLLHLI